VQGTTLAIMPIHRMSQIQAGISTVAEGGLRAGLSQGIRTAGSLATGTTKRLANLLFAGCVNANAARRKSFSESCRIQARCSTKRLLGMLFSEDLAFATHFEVRKHGIHHPSHMHEQRKCPTSWVLKA
jgi:hypothetical protein